MTAFLAFLSAMGPALVDLFRYVSDDVRSAEEDERHARAIIRAAFDARAAREIEGP